MSGHTQHADLLQGSLVAGCECQQKCDQIVGTNA